MEVENRESSSVVGNFLECNVVDEKTDLDRIREMLDKAGHPHFHYCEISGKGLFTVLVLDNKRDGGRHVPLMVFNEKKEFVEAGTRWLDP